jgi:hypothetical protein
MIDSIGQIIWYSSFVIPVCIIIAILIIYKYLSYGKRIVVALSFAFAVFVFLIETSLGIMMRDGLGPDSPIPSEGIGGIYKSISGMLLGALLAILLFLPGYYVIWKNRKDA